MKYFGKFITIEGIEGVGKSSACQFLLDYLLQKKIDVLATREPGGTEIGEEIRHILLKPRVDRMSIEAELLLVFAARAQHLTQLIYPALEQGRWVLSDRFTDASYAYQGGGRCIAMDRILLLEEWVQNHFKPDLVLLLQAPIPIALSRAKKRSGVFDRFEAETEEFFSRVQAVYLQRAREIPERYRVIDASGSFGTVKAQIQSIIDEYLDKE